MVGSKKGKNLPKVLKLSTNWYLWTYQSYSPHFGFYTPIFDPTELKNNTSKQPNLSVVTKFGLVGFKKGKNLSKLPKLFTNWYLWTYQCYSPHFGFYTPIFDPTELKNNIFKQINLQGFSKCGLVESKKGKIGQNCPHFSQIDISWSIRPTLVIFGSTPLFFTPLSSKITLQSW